KDGIGGLWEYIKEKVGDLKTMVVDGLMDMLQSQVIQAGITWLLGLLTPAGAFVKACQMIYKVVMWFINNAQRMMELVNTIIDSAADIVAHNLAGASAKVENAMAKVIPIAIGFLAGVIGIGNLSKKVGDIIDRVKVPITKAIDWVVDKAVAFADKLGITKMIEKGTKWVQDKVAKIGDKVIGWLGIKKQFKTEDGKSHSVYTEQKGDDIEILVASKIKTLRELIEDKKEEFKPKRKDTSEEKSIKAAKMNRTNDAENKYKEIKSLIPDLIVEKLKADTEKKIEVKITELVPILKDIGVEGTISDEELLDTDIEYSPDNGKAHKIIGRVISKKGSGGSEPKDDPFGWTKEVKELANSEAYWVRAHLLNASLHGKGTKDNLVPGTKTTNNSMRSSVEDPAKEAVFVQNKMIYYNVEVSYYAEQNGVFPEYIKIDWGFLKKGEGNTLIKEVNQGRRFQQELPPNEHMRSFSQSSKDRIIEAFKEASSTFGVSVNSVANAIIEVRENLPGREFIDEDQFYNKMTDYFTNRNINFKDLVKPGILNAIGEEKIKILI
ncbi:MAG: DNA/RNA non-specific endonuclease, partial [Bacteroidetes bacterium]|nr:DNA/RNA non-specific endonuclease [Bacteroidota bacterium]